MKIAFYTEDKRDAWDEYIRGSSTATFFHQIGWKNAIEGTFGYKAYYLMAVDDDSPSLTLPTRGREQKNNPMEGKEQEKNPTEVRERAVRGILPLFLIKGLLSGKALVSMPFSVYGGVCADDGETAKLLIEYAKQLTKEEGANYLELRSKTASFNGMPEKDLYATFIKELPKNTADCLENLPRKCRAACRKGLNLGLKADVSHPLNMTTLKEFYNIYAVSVRNLGSPIFPFSFLENLAREFKENITVLSVTYNNKPVAGVLTFLFKDTIMPYYAGSLPQYFKYQPNNVMYLKLMEYGAERGYRYFDFGRSKKGTGSYDFKTFFGFEPQPLHYQYFLNKIDALPDTSSVSPKVKLAVSAWKRMPVWMTKIIGPRIITLTPP